MGSGLWSPGLGVGDQGGLLRTREGLVHTNLMKI